MNPIVKLAASALPGEKKYILFAGAGVSKDAGYPTAWDLMLKTAGLLYAVGRKKIDKDVNLENWFMGSKYSKLSYSELIGEIYTKSTEQQTFLNDYLDGKEPGEAHKLITEMARRGIIRAIITTNFDHGIEKALIEKGLKLQVLSTEEELKHSEPLIHCKAIRIYKPHGNLGKGKLKNTPKDLEELDPMMEKELIKVLSEHGVIVLGYSGRDKGVQQVFRKRDYTHYPLFWIDPNQPETEMKDILELKDYTYIQSSSASKFISDYFEILDRIKDLAPDISPGPTLNELKKALENSKDTIDTLYADYLDIIYKSLEKNKPDFSSSEYPDDAIVNQIESSMDIIIKFIKASILASKFKNEKAIKTIYESFGEIYRLYTTPEGFSGYNNDLEFEGYKYLGYEMFVSFVASLIKYDNWKIIGEILRNDIFVEKSNESKYIHYTRIGQYVKALDEVRNNRLKPSRISVTADIIGNRFSDKLSILMSHYDFMQADYFLFMRSICLKESSEFLPDTWAPRSCVFLNKIPVYILKSESEKYLEKIIEASGFSEINQFIEIFKERHVEFNRFFRYREVKNPLIYFDFNRLGKLN
ncbi:MAG: SIR2 family protein [Candidatus Aureabacteria bacterium]|nr:SIR2 family protein [Candidatus Auribacterota bacterium]